MRAASSRRMGELDWQAVTRLFAEARAQPEDRLEAWLSDSGGDPAVIAEVRSLIASLERAGDFLEPSEPSAVNGVARWSLSGADPVCRFAPGDRLGRYEIVGLLGAGGMGEVYRASDTRLNRMVVLKVLPAQTAAFPEWRARLEREARAVSSLKHPHVCALYDIGQEGGVDFLVMEYLDGETLAARLHRGALPIADVLLWAQQIASALEAAHEHGIVHRDLKPANIMLTSSGAKLLDFGVAKATLAPGVVAGPAGSTSAEESITQHGALVGTAEYMSPEQIDGRPVDRRADIFAFGAVLYEMTTGRKAFSAEDCAGVFEAIRTRDVPPLRRLRRRAPRSLDRVIRTCLAKQSGARYQTAAALGQDLTAVAVSERRFRRARWLAAAVTMLAAGLGVTWPLLNQRQAPSAAERDGTRIMLAVLPFVNQSGDSSQDYLSEGITDELITELGRLYPERLGVIARTSAARYQQTRGNASRIAQELGVQYFIEGSAARAGSRLRIGVRLARAGDQTQVWAERYERELDDVLVLQAEVAQSIAREVAVALTPERRAQLDARTAIDPAAFEHYLKGRYFSGKRTREGLTRAVAEFEAATRRHPGYAAAHAGMADSYLLLAYYSYLPSDQAFARARAAARTALALDAGLAEAHVSLGGTYAWEHRWPYAEAEYEQSLRLNASYPTAHQWYANYLIGQGRVAEAQARILRARELDPLSLIIQVNVANVFLLSREYDRAIEECRKALEMEPGFVTAHWVLGRAYELKGRFPLAIAEFQRGMRTEPASTLLRAALARTYALSGARREAEALLRELSAGAPQQYISPLQLAPAHAALGQIDDAFALLDRAVAERANLLIYVKVDPAYDSLRGDPRFDALLHTLGLESRRR